MKSRIASWRKRLGRTIAGQSAGRPVPRSASYRGREGLVANAYAGAQNPRTGQGTSLDKSKGLVWSPTLFWGRTPLDIIYAESWACRKFIDLPIDDMLILWREFAGPDEDHRIEMLQQQEQEHEVIDRLRDVMKAARLFGTGLLAVVSREAPLTSEFQIEKLRKGDLISFLPFDRYECTVMERDNSIRSPHFGQPVMYRVNPSGHHSPFDIHASRVIRFDGIRMLNRREHMPYDRDWGISELVPVLQEVGYDIMISSGAANLTAESDVGVVAMEGLRESMTGALLDPTDMTPEQVGEKFSEHKSTFRTIFIDKNDTYTRESVSWSGLPDLMDKFARRLAAVAGIPATRFWGQSPVGMNATGDSDMANYAIHVTAMQNRLLTEPLHRMDEIMLRHAGDTSDLREDPVEYMWPRLVTLGEQEQAQVQQTEAGAMKTKMDALALALQNSLISPEEARECLAEDGHFGELSGGLPGFFSEQELDQIERMANIVQTEAATEKTEKEAEQVGKEPPAAQKPAPKKDASS